MWTRGLGLVQLVVSISILLVLVGLVTLAAGPGLMESRRESACADRFRAIYQAMILYSEEEGAFEEWAGLGSVSLTALSKPTVLRPYLGGKRSSLFCPAAPACAQTVLATSHHWTFVGFHPHPGRALTGAEQRVQAILDREGPKTPVARCTVHDELFYQPRERSLDPSLQRAFTLSLLLDGSVKAGRSDYPRSNTIARACAAAKSRDRTGK